MLTMDYELDLDSTGSLLGFSSTDFAFGASTDEGIGFSIKDANEFGRGSKSPKDWSDV